MEAPDTTLATVHDSAHERVRAMLAELGRLWGVPDLAATTAVRFSTRMTRSFGNCKPDVGEIAIAERVLRAPPEVLTEVVGHEGAHVAVSRLYPRWRLQPHCPEWKLLMRAAGLPPRARRPALPDDPPPRILGVWEHRCPVCAAARRARKPVRSWRCQRCLAAGGDGRIEIVRLDRPD